MTVYGKGKPEEIVIKLAELLPPRSQVLDIGSGEGRHALYLARKGFKVEAWDKDSSEIALLKEKASKESLELVAETCDMRDLRIGYDRWSAVITAFSLQYLKPEEAVERLFHIRAALLPGGYHALLLFTERGLLARQRNDRFYPRVHETLKHYEKWDILVNGLEMRTCLHRGPGDTELENETLVLLARKPV